jgi:adenylate cyclase
MYTDMVGYTALGQRNESLSLALVEEQRKLIRPILARHNGREVKTMGDAFLVEFLNATDSVRCAYDIQRATREFNLALVSDKRIHLRIGIHLGEVEESRGDISGDAVNVASRIYPLADDGGVCLTHQVYDQVSNKTELKMVSMGVKPLKNVSTPIEVYKIEMPWEQPTPSKEAVALPRDRIAILPFRNMSPDPNDEYFAEGVTEEIISTASGISGLSVISRTSVMGYKGTTKNLRQIGKELEVGSVLEGSFRKAGNKIRVTAQLIDVTSDKHLWAQNYDRNLDDVFEVQSDVAKQVAEALRVKILTLELERIEKKPTESTRAYELYLRGMYHWSKRNDPKWSEEVRQACKCYEEAVADDPNFALGYVGQADCSRSLMEGRIEREENRAKAWKMLTKALELDPSLAEAHATKGLLLMSSYDLKQAEAELKLAIELKPSYASSHQWYALLLVSELRMNEAQSQYEKAVELDPLSPTISTFHAGFYLVKRDFPKAIELAQRAAELGATGSHNTMAFAYKKMGMKDDMNREKEVVAEQLRSWYPDVRIAPDVFTARLEENRGELAKLLPEAISQFEALSKEKSRELPLSAYDMAGLHFFLGKKDLGFKWLERSYDEQDGAMLSIQWDEDLDGVRNDPRYLDLVKRLGLEETLNRK